MLSQLLRLLYLPGFIPIRSISLNLSPPLNDFPAGIGTSLDIKSVKSVNVRTYCGVVRTLYLLKRVLALGARLLLPLFHEAGMKIVVQRCLT